MAQQKESSRAESPGNISSTHTPALRAPRGAQLSCRGWEQEAALRLLLNSHDPEVAGQSAGKESIQTIVEALQSLGGDQTLIVREGKPLGRVQSPRASPRVMVLNEAPPPPVHSTGDRDARQRLASILLGESEAASWTSTGAQGPLSTAFMTLARAAQQHLGSSLEGKFVVSGGMGSLGGIIPLAATTNGAAFLGIEVDEKKIHDRIRAGYCDICVNDLDEALRILKNAIRKKEAVSVGLAGNCAEVIPEMARRGVLPDILTDLTPANDPGYLPAGLTLRQAEELRRNDSLNYRKRVEQSITRHAAGLLELRKLGAMVFDFGNGLGGASIPHFVPAYLEPSIRAGLSPLRWFALSGERVDILKLDDALLDVSPQNEILTRWLRATRKHLRFQGLPARVAWLGAEERIEFGERLNGLVAHGEVRAPVVLARDDLGGASPSFPNVEGESETALQFLCDALQDSAHEASWASWQLGATRAVLSTRAVLADGTPSAARRLGHLLREGSRPAGKTSAGE